MVAKSILFSPKGSADEELSGAFCFAVSMGCRSVTRSRSGESQAVAWERKAWISFLSLSLRCGRG